MRIHSYATDAIKDEISCDTFEDASFYMKLYSKALQTVSYKVDLKPEETQALSYFTISGKEDDGTEVILINTKTLTSKFRIKNGLNEI